MTGIDRGSERRGLWIALAAAVLLLALWVAWGLANVTGQRTHAVSEALRVARMDAMRDITVGSTRVTKLTSVIPPGFAYRVSLDALDRAGKPVSSDTVVEIRPSIGGPVEQTIAAGGWE